MKNAPSTSPKTPFVAPKLERHGKIEELTGFTFGAVNGS
jgi:hypothetical protein